MKAASLLAPITKRLKGKVALITGGAAGIGESTARLFVRHGAKVVVADVQDELGRAVCNDIGSEETICYAHCDVSRDAHVRDAVDMSVSKYGKLDIMFNNAAIPGKSSKEILSTDNEDFKRVVDVNLYGAFLGAKHAARVMVPLKRGSILFTSSVASVVNGETPHAYSATKHAVVGLTKNLCVELGRYGIRVNCISPYGVVTGMLRKVMAELGFTEEEKVEELVSRSTVLKGVKVTAEDMAEAALYLASDEARYVNGLNLIVDGGYSTTNPSFSSAIAQSFA
ncbi:PREDICTED: secoisolariciresinol dehydrogenase-like [Nelumbo nucifera]|uniref:Secoisolariciresinol dehydrogenase-like n=2 Tax=Nelumbo nucifera TaxID=4432 RepID=A0A1U7Z5Y0_NELNU|nr:PREDICTED: secoisolariciresinol dehydrogenase-like [Nelumbo nucifera]DAD48446.1 TPA_asm: hypothetical protein HUJ06_018383 [Nelumbo nucifera]